MGDGLWGRRRGMVLAVTALLLGLAACGGDDEKRGGTGPEAHRPPPRPIYSPNGEPLNGGPLGQPSCPDALSRWFDRVDANHDGTLDLEEYLADARRQFAAMDLNHDGMIDPAELTAYRAPYVPPIQAEERPQHREEGPSLGERVQRSLGLGGRPKSPEGVGNAAEQPDPVMSADVTLRNRVSLDDFLAYERRQFAELDANRDRRLSKPEVLRLCGPARS